MTEATAQDSPTFTDEERARLRVLGWDRFVLENRRASWPLELAAHGIAWASGSHMAKLSLLRHLTDLFDSHHHTRIARDDTLVPLAIQSLGDIKHVRCRAPNGGQIGLRVAASSRAAAVDHVRSLGLEPLVG